MFRLAAAAMIVAAAPAAAQTRIDSSGIHAPGVTIDGRGVRTADTAVDAAGVHVRAPAGSVRVIDTNGGSGPVDCRGGALTLNGNANRFTVTNCRSVVVNGNRDTLDVAFAGPGALSVQGNHDAVTWRAPRGAAVSVRTAGDHDTVVRR